jgi:hypothetical protein
MTVGHTERLAVVIVPASDLAIGALHTGSRDVGRGWRSHAARSRAGTTPPITRALYRAPAAKIKWCQ